MVFIKIGPQDLCDPLELAEPLGPDHDRNDRRNLSENQLKEGQLDLQAMIPVVGVRPAGEDAVSVSDQLLSQLDIDRNRPQRRIGIWI